MSYLCFASLGVSCEKEIVLDEEEIKPRIVLNSAFTSGDTLRVHLSESRSVSAVVEINKLI